MTTTRPTYEDIVGRKWCVTVHVSEQTFEGRTFEFHADYTITVRARSAILAEDEALRLIANRFRLIEAVPTLHATEVRNVL